VCRSIGIAHPVKSALRNEEHHALLMEQRDEENQQEIAKLKAEIKNLKLELFQLRSKQRRFSFSVTLMHTHLCFQIIRFYQTNCCH
jgi:predicted RNase H-like nuclease (RuvC/YqgF family)